MKCAATVIGTGVIAAASLATRAGVPIAWNNALGGDWQTAANWDPMAVPGLSDAVLIGLGGVYTVSVLGTDAAAADLTISNADATLAVRSARSLTLGQSLHNLGVVTINPTASIATTQVRVADGVVLTGTGRIVLNAPGVRSWISPVTPGASFTQSAGHTIRGEGQISTGITNHGLVLADVPGGVLILNNSPKTNHAQMSAANGGTLRFQASTINQSPTAVIGADGAGSKIEFIGVTVHGGTIQTSGGGLISISQGDATIGNLTLAGDSEIANARFLNVSGDIAHHGRMTVNPAAGTSTTSVRIADGTTFSGDGLITLNAPASRAQILPATVDASFTQASGHTIEGHGQITAGMTNNGLVVANDDGLGLILSSNPKVNNATMRAEGGGTLIFSGQTITQSPAATITADGPGSTIQLAGVTVHGGTMQTSDGGVISVLGGDSTISDVTLAGDSQITGARTLSASGHIVHTGHMVVNPAASASATSLRVTDGTAFTGDGRITLNAPGAHARITPATAGAVLTIGPGQTIGGIGQIAAAMRLEGTIAPGSSVGALIASQPITMMASAVFEAEVAGPADADQINSTSSFQANGTLNVTLVEGFNPPLTWNAVLVNATLGVSGAFDTINAPQPADNRLAFRAVYTPTQIRIGVFCTADVNADGLLNFFDISRFIADYNAGNPAADIAAPIGVLNFFDIAAFIARYNSGCP